MESKKEALSVLLDYVLPKELVDFFDLQDVRLDELNNVLQRIPEDLSSRVQEVTLDMSTSMRKIIRHNFPLASRVIDRFHVQKLAFDAIQEMRIAHRWDAINQETEDKEKAKLLNIKYRPQILSNGDTLKQLLARSRYLLFKSPEKWSESQTFMHKHILLRVIPPLAARRSPSDELLIY